MSKTYVINSSVDSSNVVWTEPKQILNFHNLDSFIYSNISSDYYVTAYYKPEDKTYVFVGIDDDCLILNTKISIIYNQANKFVFLPFKSLSLVATF